MSTFTMDLSDSDDAVIDFLTARSNAELPKDAPPLVGNQYLRQTLRGWLRSYKIELGRINSGLVLSRIPRGRWAGFFDSVDPGVVAFRESLLNAPTIGRFDDDVELGLTACVTAGVLTQGQANALVA